MSEIDTIRIGDMVLRRDLFRFAYIKATDEHDAMVFTVVIVFEGDLALEHPDAQGLPSVEEARVVLEDFHVDLLGA